jgi:hypothetical protein
MAKTSAIPLILRTNYDSIFIFKNFEKYTSDLYKYTIQ